MINCDSQSAIRAINSTVPENSTTLEATMALNTLGESNEITLRWIAAHCGNEEMNWQINLQREVLRMTELLGSNPQCPATSVTHYVALRKNTIVSWIESHKLNSPKISNILWRDKDLIRINKRLDMLVSIIISEK